MQRFLICVLLMICFACTQNRKNQQVKIEQNLPDNCLLGKEINLVRYALTSYNIKADAEEKLFSSRFRLLIFGNFYCKPCWDNVLKWDSCYFD